MKIQLEQILHFNPVMPCAFHTSQSTWPWKCIYMSERARYEDERE